MSGGISGVNGKDVTIIGNKTELLLKSQIREFIKNNSKNISEENKEALIKSIYNTINGKSDSEKEAILEGKIKVFLSSMSTKMNISVLNAVIASGLAEKILTSAMKMGVDAPSSYFSKIMDAFAGLLPAQIPMINKSGTIEQLLNKDTINVLSTIKMQLLFKMAITMNAAQLENVIVAMVKDKIDDNTSSKLLEKLNKTIPNNTNDWKSVVKGINTGPASVIEEILDGKLIYIAPMSIKEIQKK